MCGWVRVCGGMCGWVEGSVEGCGMLLCHCGKPHALWVSGQGRWERGKER